MRCPLPRSSTASSNRSASIDLTSTRSPAGETLTGLGYCAVIVRSTRAIVDERAWPGSAARQDSASATATSTPRGPCIGPDYSVGHAPCPCLASYPMVARAGPGEAGGGAWRECSRGTTTGVEAARAPAARAGRLGRDRGRDRRRRRGPGRHAPGPDCPARGEPDALPLHALAG